MTLSSMTHGDEYGGQQMSLNTTTNTKMKTMTISMTGEDEIKDKDNRDDRRQGAHTIQHLVDRSLC